MNSDSRNAPGIVAAVVVGLFIISFLIIVIRKYLLTPQVRRSRRLPYQSNRNASAITVRYLAALPNYEEVSDNRINFVSEEQQRQERQNTSENRNRRTERQNTSENGNRSGNGRITSENTRQATNATSNEGDLSNGTQNVTASAQIRGGLEVVRVGRRRNRSRRRHRHGDQSQSLIVNEATSEEETEVNL